MFIDIAAPLVKIGIPVIPVEPYQKRCLLPEWQKLATTDIEQIKLWNHDNPLFNVGCVGKPQGIVILDCDVKGLKKRIEDETGHKFPRTLVVKSGGKGTAHLYFRQNEWSRKLGNRKSPGMFDLQSVDKYVVGPGSSLGDGRIYEIKDNSPLAEFPEWLYQWIDARSTPEKKSRDGVPVDEDFDFDNFVEHYGLSGHQSGEWYVTDTCPVSGHKHEQSVRTGFFWDGSSLGWHCFASGCEGSGMSVGQVIKFLNQSHDPYDGIIWPEEPMERTLAAFEIDTELQMPEIPAQEIISPNQEPLVDPMDAAWAQQAEQFSPSPLPAPNDLDSIVFAEPGVGLVFDRRALYGKLGEIASETKMPLGWAYPGCLALSSALNINDRAGHVRSNLYVAMIAPVGMAKTAVVEAVEGSIFLPDLTKVYITPSSDRGLSKLIGQNEQRILLIEDEFRSVLGKCAVPNATLAPMICKLWSKDRAGAADKKGLDACSGRLSILGNIPVEDPSDFSRAFGSSTTYGMYSRFLYGYDTQPVRYRPFAGKAHVFSDEMVVTVPAWCWDAKDLWEGDDLSRRRMGEQALRIALVTAAGNGDKEITPLCLYAAFRFVEWQLRLRGVFKPGLAETKEAEAFEACYAALLEQHQKQQASGAWPKGADKIGHAQEAWSKFLNFTDVMKHKSYYRKYAGLVTRVRKQMEEEGIIGKVWEAETYDDGKPKKGDSTPFVRLCKLL
jgi:hypothetical protein